MAPSTRNRLHQPLWIAVDTGGTFTDCVWIASGQVQVLKVFSSPNDPSQAIVDAVARIRHGGPIVLLHGTTVGTNTLLERKGARVAFVTTAGFEDTIEIGRQARPKLYDLTFDRVPPLVERGMRFGVPERVSCTGEILRNPSGDELKLLAVRNQSLFGLVISDTEQLLDFLIHFTSRLLAAIALNLELLAIDEGRLTLSAMDQAQALTHSVHRDHLAPKCRGPFEIVLRAGTDLAEHNLLRGTTAQQAADTFQQRATREQKLVFTR